MLKTIQLEIHSKLQPVSDFSLRLIGKMKLSREADGITKLSNIIYVLFKPTIIQLFTDENPFILQSEINIAEIEDPYDILSSEKEQCLYISDYGYKCVWKMMTTDHRVIKWLEGIEDVSTLSISNDGLVLISRCIEPCSLETYSPDASLVHRIILPDNYINLMRAVMTSKGTFVIAHQMWTESDDSCRWEISEVNQDGQIINRYPNELNEPYYLSLDSDDRVFVADYQTDRVIMLDSNLKWRRILLNREEDGISFPHSLFYDRIKNEILIYFNIQKTICIYRIT